MWRPHSFSLTSMATTQLVTTLRSTCAAATSAAGAGRGCQRSYFSPEARSMTRSMTAGRSAATNSLLRVPRRLPASIEQLPVRAARAASNARRGEHYVRRTRAPSASKTVGLAVSVASPRRVSRSVGVYSSGASRAVCTICRAAARSSLVISRERGSGFRKRRTTPDASVEAARREPRGGHGHLDRCPW